MSTVRVARPVTRLTSVPYDTYVRLRDARGNCGLLMAYHDGVLEIMSPQFHHETGENRLAHVIRAYCKAFDVDYEEAGSTTFRVGLPGQLKGEGKEPDASYYLRNAAAAVVGKVSLDLMLDPPPSLWIEVDNWGSSKSKIPLYAGLGIPEVWRYQARKQTLWFGRLSGDGYDEITASVALPGLTSVTVLALIEASKPRILSTWSRWLDDVWFPEHRQELIGLGAGH